MGVQFSRTSGEGNRTTHLAPTQQELVIPDLGSYDLSSYEAACRLDPDLQSFDSALQQRTSRVINTLSVGVKAQSLSLDSFREVTECLVEMNQEVVHVILDCARDVWNDQELFDLVKEYFDNSLLNLDFCNALEKSLERARDSQLMVAFQKFEEERRERVVDGGCGGGDERKYYAETLQELKSFKAAGTPFTQEFLSDFHSVYNQQVLMLDKLQKRKQSLDKKVKSLKTWRRVSNVIFGATFAAVLICSVVAAAIAAPRVVTALAAAASVPFGTMGKLINSLWKKYENEAKQQKEIVRFIQVGTWIATNDLDSIWILVDRLEIQIESLLLNSDFAIKEEEEAVTLAMDQIKKKLSEFIQTINDLVERARKFSRDITSAKTLILEKIIKHPGSGSN